MRIPTSTYRLQMTTEFGFARARDLVPYLHRLGVGDVYLSPILQAAPGSTHGYDVADPTRLDARLGTLDEFLELSAALREHDMGLLLDIVPNHMAATPHNPWWCDVLEHGQASEYAEHFAIDWTANDGRVLIPVLGGPLDEVLARSEIQVEGGELVYFDNRYPLAPCSLEQAGARSGGATAVAVDVRELLDAQHYELADWREQATRLNYRRFFDITGLVGVQVERPHVFDDVHRFILELVRDGHVTGLRIDHVDGLRDPKRYLEQLQVAAREASGRDEEFYVVVEKILAPDEQLPSSWPVAGTTGYEFLDVCDGLFVDRDGADMIAERYAALTDVEDAFEDVVARAKLRTIRDLFWGELGALAKRVLERGGASAGSDSARSSGPDGDERTSSEIVEEELRRVRDALAVTTAQLHVYRTYVDEDGPSPQDEATIDLALAEAARSDMVDAAALATVADALRHDTELVLRWQQFSGPVTAKSVEDTAFYRYYALPARNEVGAHPSNPAGAVGGFHWAQAQRLASWPHSMNASSTHDTKRSEDVRARMMALTQRPTWWTETVERWLEELDAPDPNDGWMVASTLVGAWPIDAERLAEYVRKAVREEKLHTSWVDPDEDYEASVIAFGERLRTSGQVEPVVAKVEAIGDRSSLAMAALKLLAPGVPDVYQGTEAPFFALVDPDNRRPVDHGALSEALESDGGHQKLRLTAAVLRLRRDRRELFALGDYLPVRYEPGGAIAFARRLGTRWVLIAAATAGFQRGSSALLELPAGAPSRWRHVVTGEAVDVTGDDLPTLLRGYPVLVAEGCFEA